MNSLSLRLAYQRVSTRIPISQRVLQSTQTIKAENSTASDEYWDEPQYPPIVDLSLEARKIRKRNELHKKIQDINTVEEKQIALNMPRYYGWKCVRFNDYKVPYGALPLVQCYTRTHLVEKLGLPEAYAETEIAAAELAKEVKDLIEEVITMEYSAVKRMPNLVVDMDHSEAHSKEDALARNICRQINRIVTNKLADRLPHILSTQIDHDPRHEAFWFVGGVDPPRTIQSKRRKVTWFRHTVDDPVDRAVSYSGSPFVALRHSLPLRPLVPYSEAGNPELEVPKYTYHPETAGYFGSYMHGTNIPGFWTGDQDEFGLLAFHGRGHLLTRKSSFGEQDHNEALDCQAMKASFGWLLSQASYQGFTTYNDITYPLVAQTVITNGQLWSLYAYQLNTIEFHNELIDTNPKRNICFKTGQLKLFERFENDKIVGFNEDVLKQILLFYLNAPEERNHVMKPYLGAEEQYIADVEYDRKRNWLEKTYKHLVSNRPRHRLIPETYLWERIYKIQFNTRFQEPRRRFFELDREPFNKRLDHHRSEYIPKCLRPYPRHGKKFRDTFYPQL